VAPWAQIRSFLRAHRPASA